MLCIESILEWVKLSQGNGDPDAVGTLSALLETLTDNTYDSVETLADQLGLQSMSSCLFVIDVMLVYVMLIIACYVPVRNWESWESCR